MTTIEATVTIDASADKTWAVLADIESVAMWAPTVTAAVRTSERDSGVGASRHCDLVEGFGTLEETVLEWDEGSAISWSMLGNDGLPVADMVGRFTLSPTDRSTEARFVLKYDIVGDVPQEAQDELEVAFNMVVAGLAIGLKRFTETGQGTTYDEMVATRAQS